MAVVETEVLGEHAARLWLNRPRALNALSPELMLELDDAFRRLEANPKMRVAVFQGAGDKALSVGADLKTIIHIRDAAQGREFSTKGQAVLQHFAESRLITLAVIQGYALGGGLELALAADLRLASQEARMGLPEVGLGLIPGFGATQRLPGLIGPAKALWMMLSGERIGADEAGRLGLVNWVVDSAELEDAVRAKVQALSQKAPQAMAKVKALVRQQEARAGFDRESEAFGALVDTADAKRGIRAFLGRRIPKFDGT